MLCEIPFFTAQQGCAGTLSFKKTMGKNVHCRVGVVTSYWHCVKMTLTAHIQIWKHITKASRQHSHLYRQWTEPHRLHKLPDSSSNSHENKTQGSGLYQHIIAHSHFAFVDSALQKHVPKWYFIHRQFFTDGSCWTFPVQKSSEEK